MGIEALILASKIPVDPDSDEPITLTQPPMIEWLEKVVKISEQMPAAQMAELLAWERDNIGFNGTTTGDWPGWAKLGLPPKPIIPDTPRKPGEKDEGFFYKLNMDKLRKIK